MGTQLFFYYTNAFFFLCLFCAAQDKSQKYMYISINKKMNTNSDQQFIIIHILFTSIIHTFIT